MYIIIVPVIILIIILNTGVMQRMLPAARLHGRTLTPVQYNFYYFDYYNEFLAENELRLDELGYDTRLSNGSQMHESGVTWQEYFRQQAEAAMAEAFYYTDQAAAAGYTFTEEDLAPMRERLAEERVFQQENGISAKNYYVAYYGRGMTERAYKAELTRLYEARAYKQHLIETTPVDPAAAAAYEAAAAADYRAVDIRVITLDAIPDRGTGEIGAEQIAALEEKLGRLSARYASCVPFEELQQAFSTGRLGDREGVLTGATYTDLPEAAAEVLLKNQSALAVGQAYTAVDEETGTAYFMLLDGFGSLGSERDAQRELGREAVEAAQAAADYAVTRVQPGIRLTTV